MSQTFFKVVQQDGPARVGLFEFNCNKDVIRFFPTPYFFPVSSEIHASNMTRDDNPTPNDMWKVYLSQNFAIMTQALMFFDGRSEGTLRFWMKNQLRPPYHRLGYTGFNSPIMLDSGGFRLSFIKDATALIPYGIHPNSQVKDVLDIQLKLGAELVMSLDYPVTPFVSRDEAKNRIKMSLDNAVDMAQQISQVPDAPFYYVCVQGQHPEDYRNYIEEVFDRIGDVLPSFGLAFGIKAQPSEELKLECMVTGIRGIPEERMSSTAIHALGVSGKLGPILVAFGADTFDSSSHRENALTRKYHLEHSSEIDVVSIDPDNLTCKCLNCTTPGIMHDIVYATSERGRVVGQERSANLGAHNAYVYLRMLDRISRHINRSSVHQFLAEYVKEQNVPKRVVSWIQENNEEFSKISHGTLNLFGSLPHRIDTSRYIPYSFNYTADSFVIPKDYVPPERKKCLLVLPDVNKRPYSISFLYKGVFGALSKAIPQWSDCVHVVTFSSLYGVVPQDFEVAPEVIRDTSRAKSAKQINLIESRLTDYLNRYYPSHYDHILCYATGGTGSGRARKSFAKIVDRVDGLEIVPSTVNYNHISGTDPQNLKALVDKVRECTSIPEKQMELL